MSSLSVYHVSSPRQPDKMLTHLEDIASTLAGHGVLFERCEPSAPIPRGAGQDVIVGAFRSRIDQLVASRDYAHLGVMDIDSRSADAPGLPDGLQQEHRIDEDQTRICVAGRELVMLHLDDYVYAVLCERNDVLSIPAGTRRWFDAGEHPRLVTINLSRTANGGKPHPTGDEIATRFSGLED